MEQQALVILRGESGGRPPQAKERIRTDSGRDILYVVAMYLTLEADHRPQTGSRHEGQQHASGVIHDSNVSAWESARPASPSNWGGAVAPSPRTRQGIIQMVLFSILKSILR